MKKHDILSLIYSLLPPELLMALGMTLLAVVTTLGVILIAKFIHRLKETRRLNEPGDSNILGALCL